MLLAKTWFEVVLRLQCYKSINFKKIKERAQGVCQKTILSPFFIDPFCKKNVLINLFKFKMCRNARLCFSFLRVHKLYVLHFVHLFCICHQIFCISPAIWNIGVGSNFFLAQNFSNLNWNFVTFAQLLQVARTIWNLLWFSKLKKNAIYHTCNTFCILVDPLLEEFLLQFV